MNLTLRFPSGYAWVFQPVSGEWWLDYQGERTEGITYPPLLIVSWNPRSDAWDVISPDNGHMPDDPEADPDYIQLTREEIIALDALTRHARP